MSIDELLLQLVGDDPNGLTPLLRQWIVASRRFRAFAEQYQSKIRSKLRSPNDREALRDLLFELEIALWLLQEKRFQLAYEEQGLRTTPGPDLTVSFATKVQFHVEVTRIHGTNLEATASAGVAPPVLEVYQRKLLYVILAKLNQIKAGAQNVVLIGVVPELIETLRVDEILKELKLRIESGDSGLLARSRFQSPSAFFKQYHALSAILLYCVTVPPCVDPETPVSLLWLNQNAKYPLLAQVQTILRQLPPN